MKSNGPRSTNSGLVGAETGIGWEVANVHSTARHPTRFHNPNKRSITRKRNRFWATAPLALGLAFGSPQFSSILHAQSQAAPAGQEDQQKTEVFVGKVIKAQDGWYALLTDEQAGKGVYLDDQQKAKPFEGKNVKVTGVLEVAKNLVHVTDIQLA